MKKILTVLLLVLVMLVSSCESNPHYNVHYKLTYKIHYPSYATEQTYMFYGDNNASVSLQSSNGTNYILINYDRAPSVFGPGEIIAKTTAPVEIVSVEKVY